MAVIFILKKEPPKTHFFFFFLRDVISKLVAVQVWMLASFEKLNPFVPNDITKILKTVLKNPIDFD